jgi:hypothetical protein
MKKSTATKLWVHPVGWRTVRCTTAFVIMDSLAKKSKVVQLPRDREIPLAPLDSSLAPSSSSSDAAVNAEAVEYHSARRNKLRLHVAGWMKITPAVCASIENMSKESREFAIDPNGFKRALEDAAASDALSKLVPTAQHHSTERRSTPM